MWPNPQFSADLVIFTEEIINGKLHFLCSDKPKNKIKLWEDYMIYKHFDFDYK